MTAFSSAVVLIRESSESSLISALSAWLCLGSTNCALCWTRLSSFFSETNRYFKEKTTWHLYTYYRLSICKRGANLIFFTLCRRFAILFDSCTDLLLNATPFQKVGKWKNYMRGQRVFPKPFNIIGLRGKLNEHRLILSIFNLTLAEYYFGLRNTRSLSSFFLVPQLNALTFKKVSH